MPMPMPVSVPKVCGSVASYPLHVRRTLGPGFSKHSVLELAWLLPLLLCFSWTDCMIQYVCGSRSPEGFLVSRLQPAAQHSPDEVHGRHSATTLIIPKLQYSSGGTVQRRVPAKAPMPTVIYSTPASSCCWAIRLDISRVVCSVTWWREGKEGGIASLDREPMTGNELGL